MTLELLAVVALLLASIPASMLALNLPLYRRAPRPLPSGPDSGISVLIPARNEGRTITGAIASAQTDPDPGLEILVMDDHSEDDTAAQVLAAARRDPRVRLLQAPPLPGGWNGKQHACQALADEAANEILVFLDADVRLAPDALGRLRAELERRRADLISGVPRQITETWLERLLIPLIHFVLLGFLPMAGTRYTRLPAFAAGCGQLFAARATVYRRSGGHRAIRASRHDGLALPRAFRAAGGRTDLFDATPLASCRMYSRSSEVWTGLAKNATEGMATVAAIGPWTLLLLGGQVLPPLLLPVGWLAGGSPRAIALLAAATALGLLTRMILAWRFRQSWRGALLHPLGVLLLVAVQWYALLREASGRPIAWKGRLDAPEKEAESASRATATRPEPG